MRFDLLHNRAALVGLLMQNDRLEAQLHQKARHGLSCAFIMTMHYKHAARKCWLTVTSDSRTFRCRRMFMVSEVFPQRPLRLLQKGNGSIDTFTCVTLIIRSNVI
ncbi:hypothetical protein D3C85_1425950 [compost metagenome]